MKCNNIFCALRKKCNIWFCKDIDTASIKNCELRKAYNRIARAKDTRNHKWLAEHEKFNSRERIKARLMPY